MHELSFVAEIVENVLKFVETHGVKKVLLIRLAIGELTSLEPEQMQFCYESITNRPTPEPALIGAPASAPARTQLTIPASPIMLGDTNRSVDLQTSENSQPEQSGSPSPPSGERAGVRGQLNSKGIASFLEQTDEPFISIADDPMMALSESKLEIEIVPAKVQCPHCHYEGPPKYLDETLCARPTPTLQCPDCGRQTEPIAGHDCAIKNIRYVT